MNTNKKYTSQENIHNIDNASVDGQSSDENNVPLFTGIDKEKYDDNLQGKTLGWIDRVLGVTHARINVAFITIVLMLLIIVINMLVFGIPLVMESWIGLLGTIIGYLFGKGV